MDKLRFSEVFVICINIIVLHGLPLQKTPEIMDKFKIAIHEKLGSPGTSVQLENGTNGVNDTMHSSLITYMRQNLSLDNIPPLINNVSNNKKLYALSANYTFKKAIMHNSSEIKAKQSYERLSEILEFETAHENETNTEYQNDVADVMEKPTAEIRVTVIRRSGRYWEPWELNYSEFYLFTNRVNWGNVSEYPS